MPMNMSHCRFENTLYALIECSDALAEIVDLDDLQTSEASAARKLVKLCAEIACDWSGDDQPPEQEHEIEAAKEKSFCEARKTDIQSMIEDFLPAISYKCTAEAPGQAAECRFSNGLDADGWCRWNTSKAGNFGDLCHSKEARAKALDVLDH